jgi:hypothetical protein
LKLRRTTSRSTTRHGPSGRRMSRNERIRSVIMGKAPKPKRCSPGSPAPARPALETGERHWIPPSGRKAGMVAPKSPHDLRHGEPSLGNGRSRSARPARKVCASSVSPAFGGPTETKKALHRRCFKPPSQRPRRPQARANLGSVDVCVSRPRCKRKSARLASTMRPKLVPELICSDYEASLGFYVQRLGFRVLYARGEDRFAFLNGKGRNS